jgi:Flp pilus assembly pilin Flp
MTTLTVESLRNAIRRFAKEQDGSNAVEYVAIAALVAIALFGAWTAFGEAVAAKIDEKAGDVAGL